jgi:trk system potassium uptake protein
VVKMQAPREAYGRSLSDAALRRKYGVTVVGVKRPGQDFTYAQADTVLESGDLLIVSGPTEVVERFAAETAD